jgi:hypothetical protein
VVAHGIAASPGRGREEITALRQIRLQSTSDAGCGRLPTPAEMVAQMKKAGFADVKRRTLVPGESFYSFVGVTASR